MLKTFATIALLALGATWPAMRAAHGTEPAPPPVAEHCQVPEELAFSDVRLPRFAAQIAQPGAHTIIVVSPVPAAAMGVSSDKLSYAARLQDELARRLPRAGLRVQMVAGRRAAVAAMARLITAEVLPRSPALVIWQIGRTDATDGTPVHRFGQEVEAVLERLDASGIDTLLVDIAYNPQAEMLARSRDYRSYVRWIATRQNVMLLRRFEMTQYWSENDVIDLETHDANAQHKAADQVHECVAWQLAQMIELGLSAAPAR